MICVNEVMAGNKITRPSRIRSFFIGMLLMIEN
jgi:hypothetical protein